MQVLDHQHQRHVPGKSLDRLAEDVVQLSPRKGHGAREGIQGLCHHARWGTEEGTMSEIRLISQGATNDHDALLDVVERSAAVVRAKEPGVTRWECYSDGTSGRVVWFEDFVNADAFLGRVQTMQSQGLLDDLFKVYEIERITFLVPVDDERVRSIVEQFGFIEAQCRHSLVR